jgi:Ser/Thr protein kinase RdoA (MazF antagonist)
MSGGAAAPGAEPGAGHGEADALVHGMGRELVPPDWPALTDDEVGAVLAAYPGGDAADRPVITWRSPRPMSAAALVRRGADGAPGRCVFVKRHHVAVRTTEQLHTEHALATCLRLRGVPVPAVLRDTAGGTVACRGDFRYEVHEVADGVDLYRDAPSWSPFTSAGHARAAGAALARLHDAAAGFPLPERRPAPLLSSCSVVAAGSPADAVAALATALPALAEYLGRRDWRADLDADLRAPIERAGPLLAALPRQWGHGDWHPSNLTWTDSGPDAAVAGVLDLSLANRTAAVHDLAVALERSVVSWLDLGPRGHAVADLAAAGALLDGYEDVRPLTDLEAAALAAVLPVAHVEYALSEIAYFGLVAAPANADLAYDGYLLGHARWFAGPEGTALLDWIRRRPRTAAGW